MSSRETTNHANSELIKRPVQIRNRLKYIIIGKQETGKADLVKTISLIDSVDGTNYKPISTIGIDFFIKEFEDPISKTKFKVQFWDTAGYERYRVIIQSYYKGSDLGIFLYTETSDCDIESFIYNFKIQSDGMIVIIKNVSNSSIIKLDNIYDSIHHYMLDVKNTSDVKLLLSIIQPPLIN
jgi:GTPase SAR1 family protein